MPSNEPQPSDSSHIRVSLITCAPGKEIFQLEGHTALRMVKTDTKGRTVYDLAVNWGVFDFAAPGFVYRFVKGETDYMACAYPFSLFIKEYRHEGRRVVEQVIDLSPQQAQKVEAMVSENILPENRVYRYNYVRDNCATRPLALLETAIGTSFHLPGDSITSNDEELTFRKEMTRYHQNYPWYQFGIDLALGASLDNPISNRHRTFAPIFLEKQLAQATYADSTGNVHNVVNETNILNDIHADAAISAPTPWILTPMAAGIALMLITLALSYRDIRRKRSSRWFDTILYSTFFIEGCITTFLVFVSTHEATSPNWLLLCFNPLCIIPALCIWIKKLKGVVYCYQICNFVALILLLAGHHTLGQALNPALPLFILCNLMRSFTWIFIHRTSPRK